MTADFSDAYMHFRIDDRELKHCLTMDIDPTYIILWFMMAFGFKAAPLIWGRLAAALGRIVQSLFKDDEVRLQVYMDDPIFIMVGGLSRRNRNISLALMVICALGVKISWKKGGRGTDAAWIGISFAILWSKKLLHLTVPERMLREVCDETSALAKESMVGVKRLRSYTGRLSWVAGVLPRLRWTVCILYAVVYSSEEDKASGVEEQRRLNRSDNRPKHYLVAVKRFALALLWISTLLKAAGPSLERVVPLRPALFPWTLVTDASPWGLAALLVANASGQVVEYAWSPLTAEDYVNLLINIGDCNSQAIVETLAILMGFKVFASRFKSHHVNVPVRSDSVVALSVTDKLSSSNPVLNFLGAELAMELELTNVGTVEGTHIPGSMNVVADYLSRLAAPDGPPGERPPILEHVKERLMPKRTEDLFYLPVPGRHLERWVGAACVDAWVV